MARFSIFVLPGVIVGITCSATSGLAESIETVDPRFEEIKASAVEAERSPQFETASPVLDTVLDGVLDVAQIPDPNDPNRDRFLQPAPEPLLPEATQDDPVLPAPAEAEPELLPVEPPAGEPLPAEPTTQFPIREIRVVGSTVFGPEDFAPLVQPLAGQQVTLEDLQQVADQITQLYLNEGYLTSRAIVAQQTITDGVVQIQVIEGRVSEIRIEGHERLNASYIRQRVQLGATAPLRIAQLEDQLRLLRADPLLDNVEASLRAGDAVGESILIVRVSEAQPWFGELRANNYSPPSVGSDQIGAALGYRNVTGLGDEIFVSYDRTTRDASAEILELGYRVPLNPRDGTLQIRAVFDENEVIQEPFDDLGIEGESERYEISFRQPLIRTPREEFALSLGFSYKDGQTFLFNDIPTPFGFGPDSNGVSRTSVVRFGQDYVSRDVQGAWALRSQLNFGLDLFNATVNPEPIPDSRFVSWLAQAQRVQRLSESQLLIVQADLQLTPDSLLASEQFVIGGGQSLRGYRQNARSGDNGFRFSVEDRITLARNEAGASTFQLAPFVEAGAVWNSGNNPNQLPDQTFLASIGLGILWEMVPNLNLRLDFALPFVDLDDRGENAQDNGIYFSVNYELFQ